MDSIRKNIRQVFWLYFVLFFLVAAFLAKYLFFGRQDIVSNSYNKRLSVIDGKIARGQILDASGVVLAENGEKSDRNYPLGRKFTHIVGFTAKGKAGVEAKYTLAMQTLDMEALRRIQNLISDIPLTGNSVVLTLDAGLQKLAYDTLAGQNGAIVVMEPSTGKILACVSYPDYDPNNINEQWEELNRNQDSPFINRATQGLYPPGSIFKAVTVLAAVSGADPFEDKSYVCTGSANFNGKKIRCYDGKAHGDVNLEKAFTVSCNTYFADIAMKIGGGALRSVADKLYFNSALSFELDYVKSSFPLDSGASDSELVETAIGQGRTLVTPLHMAMLASAVANGGVMMQPYVVDYVQTQSGAHREKHMPKMLGQVMTNAQAALLTNMMESVVTSGTGIRAVSDGTAIAGKTGTAENSSGKDHGWFIAFAPARSPVVAVSIVLENGGGSAKTLPIAKELIEYVINE